jgi:hypothetical protein
MALRSFEDREGTQWRVWSVVPATSAAVTLDEEYRSGWLCFERLHGGDRRRLTLSEAPASWETLSDDRLDLLRRVAMPVTSAAGDAPAAETITGKRPIENAARDRPSAAGGATSGNDDDARL